MMSSVFFRSRQEAEHIEIQQTWEEPPFPARTDAARAHFGVLADWENVPPPPANKTPPQNLPQPFRSLVSTGEERGR